MADKNANNFLQVLISAIISWTFPSRLALEQSLLHLVKTRWRDEDKIDEDKKTKIKKCNSNISSQNSKWPTKTYIIFIRYSHQRLALEQTLLLLAKTRWRDNKKWNSNIISHKSKMADKNSNNSLQVFREAISSWTFPFFFFLLIEDEGTIKKWNSHISQKFQNGRQKRKQLPWSLHISD